MMNLMQKSRLGSANPDINDIAKTNVPHTRMRFRQRLFSEETTMLSGGVMGSMSPTALGQYNTRMLLSPSRGRTRNSEVIRQEQRGKLAMCECHANGKGGPPLLDLAASAPNTKARQYTTPGAFGVASVAGVSEEAIVGADQSGRKDYWLKHGKREDASMLLQVELSKDESDDLEGESSTGESEDVEEFLDALEDDSGGLSPGQGPVGAARKRRMSKEGAALAAL